MAPHYIYGPKISQLSSPVLHVHGDLSLDQLLLKLNDLLIETLHLTLPSLEQLSLFRDLLRLLRGVVEPEGELSLQRVATVRQLAH